LEQLLAALQGIAEQGVISPRARYWAATANALLGRPGPASNLLAEARAAGWSHEWWERLDWNAQAL
jgi:hypothetical protein